MKHMDFKLESFRGVAHSSPLSQLLQTVAMETQRQLRLPQMLSSPLTVHLLQSLIRASCARRILEIGTYTGFTALGMAEILPTEGVVVCLDDFSDEAWLGHGLRVGSVSKEVVDEHEAHGPWLMLAPLHQS